MRSKVHFDGSDVEPSKKVTVIHPTFYIKNDDRIQDLGEAIEQNNLQKFKCLESCLRCMLKLRIDRSIICIASVNGSVVQSEAYSVSFDIHHFVRTNFAAMAGK